MKKAYFVQVGVDFGKSVYLPYAAGAIVAACLAHPQIKKEYEFPCFIYTREKLADALRKLEQPFLVAFSCNIWNIEYNKALAKLIKEKYPDCLIIFGGHSVGDSVALLQDVPVVDLLVFGEGEPVFPALLLQLLNGTQTLQSVPSIAFRQNGTVVRTPLCSPGDLAEYPSPYTTGVFDQMMAENPEADFSTVLETNRGCPYCCAFCDWTHGRKMRFFDEKKIKEEVLWMAQRKIEFCYCVDSNFGMFPRDLELVDFMVETKRKYGYPKIFRTNYEKNCTDRVFQICNTLNSVGMDRGATISYQTLSPEALKNIGRKNLTLEHFSDLMRRYNEAGIATYSELILGFPGETYESFCRGICTLLEQGQHSSLYVYLCELLPNAVMADPAFIEKHKIRSMKVYFKNAHSKANTEDEVHEYSCLVRATETMDEDAWVAANLFSTCVQCFHSLGVLRFFAVYLYYEHITDYFTFYAGLNDFLLSSDGKLGALWRDFKERYDNSLKGNWHYYNPMFGNITWTYEEGAFLEAAYAWDDAIGELLPFLRRFDIAQDVFEDLLAYQRMMIKKPFDTPCETVLQHNIPIYFENLFERKSAELRKEKTVFGILPKQQYTDWETYAREVVWYGRRKEANFYHRDSYYVKKLK